MNIAVFCSANNDIDPDFFHLAEELGKEIARKGHTLVYGGVNSGLMECIGKAVHENGGRTIGVVPKLSERGVKLSDYVDVHIPCDNLSDRKDLMLMHSDMAIALPGGIGTLDEVFTMAASATIGYHDKQVIVYNMKGFWNQLEILLNDLEAKKMIRGDYRRLIKFTDEMPKI
jgi:uncharacterized protein (TIGR00730 family)